MAEERTSRLQLIQNLKEQLTNTDYMVIKSLEGRGLDDPDIMAKRQLWREQVATLEGMTDEQYDEWVEPVVETFVKEVPSADDIVGQLKEFLKEQVETLDDEKAIEVAALFPAWADLIGQDAALGLRVWYDNDLFKCVQPHTIQAGWTPRTTPALWVAVSLDEWPPIPENIPAENAWMKGDKGTWEGEHYISLIDNNVWNPDQYPAGWEKQA